MAIDNHGSILEDRPSIHQIILDPRRACDADASIDTCRDRDPPPVADRRDRFARGVEFPDQPQNIGITSQFIRHKATWDE
ncbi:hypothetical protein Poly21_49440 [Allorhodopirellula heiligendammensis]|uniref:Uncharacterized protein n=1 Tax=Allorhodopirellula heiligendammensis TaxID=2714739 RepID=A0A5C6BH89_9BACT|nr:hypothetical protein Poly21_49440 [Allorhodopirellula heiligendammensis]